MAEQLLPAFEHLETALGRLLVVYGATLDKLLTGSTDFTDEELALIAAARRAQTGRRVRGRRVG